jgi:hypothetical protein
MILALASGRAARKKTPNNRFNLTKPLSRLVLFASLTYARSAPSPAGAVFQVKRMLGGRAFARINLMIIRRRNGYYF